MNAKKLWNELKTLKTGANGNATLRPYAPVENAGNDDVDITDYIR